MSRQFSRKAICGLATVAVAAPAYTGVNTLQADEKPTNGHNLESLFGPRGIVALKSSEKN